MSSKYSISLLFIVSSLIINPVQAQKIFREGYITKNNGQTIQGLIEWKSGQGTPASCVFKRFEIAVEVKFSADDITDFGYNDGNRYESIVNEGKKEFYEVLVKGGLTLYSKGSRYFARKTDTGFLELKNDVSFDSPKGQLRFNSLKDLMAYLTEEKINIPEEKDIKKDLFIIVTEFNKTSGGYIAYKQNYTARPLTNVSLRSGKDYRRYGFSAGMNVYTLSAAVKSNVSAFVPNASAEYAFTGGLTFESMLSRKNDHLNLRIDLLFLKQNFYSYSESTLSSQIMRDDAFYEFSAVKVPVSFQYSFNSGKVVPFLTAGVSGMLILKNDYLHVREAEIPYYHRVYTTEDKNIKFKNTEITGLAGAGIRFRVFNDLRLSLTGGVEFGSGIYKQNQTAAIGLVEFKQHSIQKFILAGITF
ncbi:MAG TPA: hypothetical protein VHO68_16260 [Bacteroidales bacterium]|nr:hypothetical protein [Bacteroidales bacterium]